MSTGGDLQHANESIFIKFEGSRSGYPVLLYAINFAAENVGGEEAMSICRYGSKTPQNEYYGTTEESWRY